MDYILVGIIFCGRRKLLVGISGCVVIEFDLRPFTFGVGKVITFVYTTQI